MSPHARIVAIAVSYRSDDAAFAWVNAVGRALQPVRRIAEVVVVDNTERADSAAFFARLRTVDPAVIAMKAPGNLGYFGGARYAWEEWQRSTSRLPDWVMVSNVDVGFHDGGFFLKLLASTYPAGTGVIAPSICSAARHGDWNPKIRRRPSRNRIHAYKALFGNHWVLNLYEMAARIKHAAQGLTRRLKGREDGPKDNAVQKIYAPHGACMLFAREYFERGGDLNFPGFLFGEEVFVGETARRLQLGVVYDPRLRMTSSDHVSTGRFRSRHMAKYMYDSAAILAERYFP